MNILTGTITMTPHKIRIDGNKLDFVNNVEDLQYVFDLIDAQLEKLGLL